MTDEFMLNEEMYKKLNDFKNKMEEELTPDEILSLVLSYLANLPDETVALVFGMVEGIKEMEYQSKSKEANKMFS